MPAESEISEPHTSATEAATTDAYEPLSPLALIELGLSQLRDRTITNSTDAAQQMIELESIQRQARALSIDLLGVCEQDGLHYRDGHRSANTMMRHVVRLAGGEASSREQCRKMFDRLPTIADAYRTGSLGTDQVKLLGRVFANERVRGAMEGRQDWFLDLAERLSFKRFQEKVLEWQSLIDEDGTEPVGDRIAANRNVRLDQDPTDLSWDLKGIFTSVDGATNKAVLDAYVEMLFDADWAEAKARVGENVCKDDLARTDAQRRADAMTQIFAVAGTSDSEMAPAKVQHQVVWSLSAHEEMARRFAGAEPRPFDVDDYRCETVDGYRLDPTEAFANSFVNKIRRIVVDAAGVVIDMGTARAFTGLARDAVRISGQECYWPGCWVPASRCETDHLDDHAGGGRTNPGNGAPVCGRHNRWKQKGYKVWRDEHGHIHVQRPDGTEIA